MQEVLNNITAYLQYYHHLSSSVWSTKLWLSAESSNQVAPVIVKMPSFTEKVMHKDGWKSSPFFAFEKGINYTQKFMLLVMVMVKVPMYPSTYML